MNALIVILGSIAAVFSLVGLLAAVAKLRSIDKRRGRGPGNSSDR